jgi:hypothetical protein
MTREQVEEVRERVDALEADVREYLDQIHEAEDRLKKAANPADEEKLRDLKEQYAQLVDQLESAREMLQYRMRQEIAEGIQPIDVPRKS